MPHSTQNFRLDITKACPFCSAEPHFICGHVMSHEKVEQNSLTELDRVRLVRKIDDLSDVIKVLEDTILEQKQRLDDVSKYDRKDVWFWQGDGHDNPESMVNDLLVVVIRAKDLREIMKK